MRYLSATPAKQLEKEYDIIIGWGTMDYEFCRRYNPTLYRMDYLVNGLSDGKGSVLCGKKVHGPDLFEKVNIDNKKVLVIIYPNIEDIIYAQVSQLLPNADTIIHRLIICDNISEEKRNFSTECEDLIFMDLVRKLNLSSDLLYVDIGVCHPVIRNNTYMFYSKGYYNGILVEPNPTMYEFCKEYRPLNTILNCGITGGENSSLTYIKYPSKPGFNHFKSGNEIKEQFEHSETDIPVININEFFRKNTEKCPDVLDIDTEGMDYEILKALDVETYPVKIICAEKSRKYNILELMTEKGYTHYMGTRENMIFVLNSELDKLLS